MVGGVEVKLPGTKSRNTNPESPKQKTAIWFSLFPLTTVVPQQIQLSGVMPVDLDESKMVGGIDTRCQTKFKVSEERKDGWACG